MTEKKSATAPEARRVTLAEIVDRTGAKSGGLLSDRERRETVAKSLAYFLDANGIKVLELKPRPAKARPSFAVLTDADGERRLRGNLGLAGPSGKGKRRLVVLELSGDRAATLEAGKVADAFELAIRWTMYQEDRMALLDEIRSKLVEAEKLADELTEAAAPFAKDATRFVMSNEGSACMAVSSALREVEWAIDPEKAAGDAVGGLQRARGGRGPRKA